VFLVHCVGSHLETNIDDQSTRHMIRVPSDDITDFSFYIGYRLLSQATQWTVADDEPVYRGHTACETGIPNLATRADSAQIQQFNAWLEKRTALGLPPWVGPQDAASYEQRHRAGARSQPQDTDALRSSWTLRQWADNYCESHSRFKEFVYEKARLHFKHVLGAKFTLTDMRMT
jgi:hypothetical protein